MVTTLFVKAETGFTSTPTIDRVCMRVLRAPVLKTVPARVM